MSPAGAGIAEHANTVRVHMLAGESGGDFEVSFSVTTDASGSDEYASGFVSSDREHPSLTVDHARPGRGRLAVGFDPVEASVEILPTGGTFTWRIGLFGELESAELLTFVLATPQRAIQSAELGGVVGDLQASVELRGGAGSIRADDGMPGSLGVVAGPVAVSGGELRVESEHPLLSVPAWTDCVGACAYFTSPPDGTEYTTTAEGDPITGSHSATSTGRPASFIDEAGRWRFQWFGSYATYLSPYGVLLGSAPPVSEPVVYIHMPADGLRTSTRTW